MPDKRLVKGAVGKVLLLAVSNPALNRPLFGGKTHCNLPRRPGNDWAFDGAGMCQHDFFGAGAVCHARLLCCIQLAPCAAFAVQQGLPTDCFQPEIQGFRGNALFFEVVK